MYDIFGNRIQKSVDADGEGAADAVATRYAFDGWNPGKPPAIGLENFDIWATFDGEGSLTTRFLEGEGFDDHLARIEGANAFWTLADRLHSITFVLDADGAVVDEITYDGFGAILTETSSPNRGPFAHAGGQLDPETNLALFGVRYLAYDTSRWMQEDPIGFTAGDPNLYRYVGNNTMNAVDPSGLDYVTVRGNRVFWVFQWRNVGDWWDSIEDVGEVQIGTVRGVADSWYGYWTYTSGSTIDFLPLGGRNIAPMSLNQLRNIASNQTNIMTNAFRPTIGDDAEGQRAAGNLISRGVQANIDRQRAVDNLAHLRRMGNAPPVLSGPPGASTPIQTVWDGVRQQDLQVNEAGIQIGVNTSVIGADAPLSARIFTSGGFGDQVILAAAPFGAVGVANAGNPTVSGPRPGRVGGSAHRTDVATQRGPGNQPIQPVAVGIRTGTATRPDTTPPPAPPPRPGAPPRPSTRPPTPTVTAIAENGMRVQSVPAGGYHGTSGQTIPAIIADGLPGGGSNMNIAEHVSQIGAPSGFRGLAPTPGRGGSAGLRTPVEAAGEGGLVVQVEGVPGFDTAVHAPNAVRQLPRPEAEIATPRRIPTENIIRIGRVTLDTLGREVVRQEDWVPNPNYRPAQ